MIDVTVYQDLDALPSACNALFDEAEKIGIFLGRPWFANLAKYGLSENDILRVYVATNGSDVCGILPMRYDDVGGGSGCRRLDALSNYYASLFVPILRDWNDKAVLQALVDALATDAMRFAIVDLHPMPYGVPSFDLTLTALKKAGMLVQPYFCFGNWYLELGGRNYREYYDSLPSKLKNTLKRKTKQLESGSGARIEIVNSIGDVDRAIAAYEKVYHSSWKKPEPHPDFMPGLIRACADQGWLRLGLVYIDDEPVAAQVWIVQGGIAAIYKLAYDERYAKLSAGSILTSRLMEHVIDVDKVTEIDYLTGDDDYKKDWMSHRRERWGLVAFNKRTVCGLLKGSAHLAWRAIREALNKSHMSRVAVKSR